MSKNIGVDVSKQTLDVAFQKPEGGWTDLKVSNNAEGFNIILGHVHKGDVVIMEASGPYYVQLAMFLFEKGVTVCVENPLVIRRYSQMLMQRAKTDRKDARTIANYGSVGKLKPWKPDREECQKLKQLYTACELMQKQEHQTSRQLEAFESSGLLDQNLRKELRASITVIKRRRGRLEKQMEELAESAYSDVLKRLTSIPGIGKKTAMFLAVLTDGFTKFDHYKKLIAYVGFSPRIYQSGTSVKGKGHICKMGKPQIRKLLYLCSWAAKRCNKTCIEMYERLKAKGKPERVIKVAIANKLLKQAFAIATQKTIYNENYSKNICF